MRFSSSSLDLWSILDGMNSHGNRCKLISNQRLLDYIFVSFWTSEREKYFLVDWERERGRSGYEEFFHWLGEAERWRGSERAREREPFWYSVRWTSLFYYAYQNNHIHIITLAIYFTENDMMCFVLGENYFIVETRHN